MVPHNKAKAKKSLPNAGKAPDGAISSDEENAHDDDPSDDDDDDDEVNDNENESEAPEKYKYTTSDKNQYNPTLANCGYKDTTDGLPDKTTKPPMEMQVLLRLYPKLLFEQLHPLFNASMKDVANLCSTYYKYNKNRIDAINPTKVSAWLNQKPKSNTKGKKEQDAKKELKLHVVLPTCKTNIERIMKERKASNFAYRFDIQNNAVVQRNMDPTLTVKALTNPLSLNDIFEGVINMNLKGEGSIHYCFDDAMAFPELEDVLYLKNLYSMTGTGTYGQDTLEGHNLPVSGMAFDAVRLRRRDESVVQKFNIGYPLTLPSLYDNIKLLSSELSILAMKDDGRPSSYDKLRIVMLGLHKLRAVCDLIADVFAQHKKRMLSNHYIELYRIFIKILVLDALHFLAPLTETKDEENIKPILDSRILTLILYTTGGKENIVWHPELEDEKKTFDYLFGIKFLPSITSCLDDLKLQAERAQHTELLKDIQETQIEIHAEKELYTNSDLGYIAVGGVNSVVEFIPEGFKTNEKFFKEFGEHLITTVDGKISNAELKKSPHWWVRAFQELIELYIKKGKRGQA